MSYQVQVVDARGRLLQSGQMRPHGSDVCFPVGRAAAPGIDQPVVQITTTLAGSRAGPPQDRTLPARIYLRHVPGEQRLMVVALERDETRDQTRDGRAAEDRTRAWSRALLLGPRLVSQAAFWPVLKASDALEYHHVPSWIQAVLTSDDGKVGVRPELEYSTGFVSMIGGRFFYRRLPGAGSELAFRIRAGFSGALLAEAGVQVPSQVGLHLRGQWQRRFDRLFAGIGPASDAELAAQGRGEVRYSAETGLAELGWSLPAPGRWSLDLFGQVERQRYDTDDVVGGPPLTEFYGLPPESCAALGLPPGCADPTQVPGFNGGLRLLRVGGTAALAFGDRARHGTGARLSTGVVLAQGIAGDPSQHVRLDGQGVFSLADLDRALLLRLRGATIETLGPAPVPFDELVLASGPTGMRGYAEGRFRGDSALVATAEYRWLISCRIDASLFTDLGTVAGPHFSDLFDSPDLFPSFGVGLRWYESISPHWTAVPTAAFRSPMAPTRASGCCCPWPPSDACRRRRHNRHSLVVAGKRHHDREPHRDEPDIDERKLSGRQVQEVDTGKHGPTGNQITEAQKEGVDRCLRFVFRGPAGRKEERVADGVLQ